MLDRNTIESATKKLRRFPEIKLAYLFGSAAKGKRPPRDIDIALLFDRPLAPMKSLSLRMKLADDLTAHLGMDVDVVILNAASPFLKYQVLKYGQLLFERRRGINAKLRYDTMTEYFDVLPLHNFFVAKMSEEHRKSHGRSKAR